MVGANDRLSLGARRYGGSIPSGPGLFLHAVRASLLGVREHFEDVIFDPSCLQASTWSQGANRSLRRARRASLLGEDGLLHPKISKD